jgi:hypothetical protein
MKRIFEFECADGHRTEAYTDYEQRTTYCSVCHKAASRVISSPRIGLEGITGAFPTASDAWARKHEEATRLARERNRGREDA